MDKQEIKDLFDRFRILVARHEEPEVLDMILRELSRITGRTVRELQRILMEKD